MACNEPYQNPAGLKFVTRTEIKARLDDGVTDNPRWPDDLPYLDDRLIMNIPNGAGPGTVILQSANAYVDWRIVGTKNLVRSTQRAYTGASSWEEVFVEDGCFIHARVQSDAAIEFNVDGISGGVVDREKVTLRALWFPNSANIPTFDRLSLISGGISPAAANGFPMRDIADGVSAFFAPPGLCRYFQVSLNGNYNWNLVRDADTNTPYQGVQAATGFAYGFCPSWLCLQVTNDSGFLATYSIGWNRFPMTGGA